MTFTRSHIYSRRAAFSLLEVLVAIAVLLVLSAAVYAFIFQLMSMREAIADRSERDAALTFAFDVVAASIMTCEVVGVEGEPGIVGTATSLELVCRTSSLASPIATSEPSGLMRRVEWNQRDQSVWIDDADQDPAITGIARLRFRYHDGRSWSSTYDSAALGRLPFMIEMAVWFAGRGEALEASSLRSSPLDAELRRESFDFPEGMDSENPLDDLEPLSPPDAVRIFVCPDAADQGWEAGDA